MKQFKDKSWSEIFQLFRENLNSLNTNVYFAGLMMLFLNVGSRYVTIELSKTQKELLHSTMAKQVIIFTMAWVATRDIITALILTAVFHILVAHLFNEDSRFCIMPERLKHLENLIDENNDGIISEDEIRRAASILEKARKRDRQEEYGRFLFGGF
jgi:hypothetical protein